MNSLLRFEGVTLVRGGRLLFEKLDLDIGPGEALQVIGPNGSGKSSLIRLAAGLLHAEQGRIDRATLVLSDDFAALDRELPLIQALRFWEASPDYAMDIFGIAHLSDVPVRLLSSGQIKRATLVRVAASDAKLWLLDEPLNGLDTASVGLLGQAIDRHRTAGGAVLAASHLPLPGEWRPLRLQP